MEKMKKCVKARASELLELAYSQFDNILSHEELKEKIKEAYELGRAQQLKTYLKECEAFDEKFLESLDEDGRRSLGRLIAGVKTRWTMEMPKWKRCPCNFEHGGLGVTKEGEDILSYKGYEILLSELEKLPKKD